MEETIDLAGLEEKVRDVEVKGIGSLGRDDLFVKVADLKFRFCNDCDVHIYFSNLGDSDVENFYVRWKQKGYKPAEWVKNQENGPGERVRDN